MEPKVIIIGGGFSSLAAAAYLAQAGFTVEVYEKNKQLGGRARVLERDGFKFDMGPSFYWMPDVFERFFADFGKTVGDYYQLDKLNPAYQVVFSPEHRIKIEDTPEKIAATFESIEPGSGKKLKKFLRQAEENYKLAIGDLVYQPGENILEIITPKTAMKLPLFLRSIKKDVSKVVKNPMLRKILEFPVLFLGAKSSDTPAMYNFMNYGDFGLGTWYPQGGMYEVVRAMQSLAEELGVKFHTGTAVEKIRTADGEVQGITVDGEEKTADIVLSGADYAHTEKLLDSDYRQYSDKYWEGRKLAPSALLFYVGFREKMQNLSHHTLFFDSDFGEHEQAIYDEPGLPEKPLFYASFPSMTDADFAPAGMEAGTFLIPLAPGLEMTEEDIAQYWENLLERIEKIEGRKLRDAVLFVDKYTVQDFEKDYNSLRGNAYGLANTLMQTHILRPRLRNKKLKNMYYAGQLSLPGPGVPPSIISGKIVSDMIIKKHKQAHTA